MGDLVLLKTKNTQTDVASALCPGCKPVDVGFCMLMGYMLHF